MSPRHKNFPGGPIKFKRFPEFPGTVHTLI